MHADSKLRDLEELFTSSARTVEPTTEARHRKPSGDGDQRTSED